MQTKVQRYKDAGLPLCPSGCINEYQFQKYLNGGVASCKDSTWIKTGTAVSVGGHKRPVGYHKCCGSKRSYRHKVDCQYIKDLSTDDLSDLK